MNGKKIFLVTPLLLFLFLSCSLFPPDIVLFCDPYAELIYFRAKENRQKVYEAVKSKGKRLHLVFFDQFSEPEARDKVETFLEKRSSSSIVMTPLTAAVLSGIESDYPSRFFYYIDYSPLKDDNKPATDNGAGHSSNVIQVDVLREESYRKAGELFGAYTRGENDGRAAALFYTGTGERRTESEAFQQGFSAVGDASDLFYGEIEDLRHSKEALQFLDELETRDVRFLFLSLSELNPVCVDHLLTKDILIATEDAEPTNAYSERILFSIETDYAEIMSVIAQSENHRETGVLPVRSVIKEGGAREAKRFLEGGT